MRTLKLLAAAGLAILGTSCAYGYGGYPGYSYGGGYGGGYSGYGYGSGYTRPVYYSQPTYYQSSSWSQWHHHHDHDGDRDDYDHH